MDTMTSQYFITSRTHKYSDVEIATQVIPVERILKKLFAYNVYNIMVWQGM